MHFVRIVHLYVMSSTGVDHVSLFISGEHNPSSSSWPLVDNTRRSVWQGADESPFRSRTGRHNYAIEISRRCQIGSIRYTCVFTSNRVRLFSIMWSSCKTFSIKIRFSWRRFSENTTCEHLEIQKKNATVAWINCNGRSRSRFIISAQIFLLISGFGKHACIFFF